MTKVELMKTLAEKTGMKQKDINTVIDAFGEVVLDVISKNEYVKFSNVCTFKGVDKAPRTARVPSTGEIIQIPAKTGQPKAVFTKTAKQ